MGKASSEDHLEKIYIDLPNHWAVSGESVWAKPLGNDLFEIRNIPFYAYGLNWGDTVRAKLSEPNTKPEILEVITPIGNKTIRIIFNEEIDIKSQNDYLQILTQFNLTYERANNNLVALDIEPNSNLEILCQKLDELEQENVLEYETCESRVINSFDAAL